ncbi:hypothetical protein J3R82DRAFT_1694 [Butyriboletus roseoflavus]|nr:hypothetical protein J3R82DRAFT_1694 [Butyriboletus roseoflavus]
MPSSISESEPEPEQGRTRFLGFASHIYLISLPERKDRHEQMELLRTALNLSWTIVDATPFTNPLVYRLLDWVVHQREQTPLGVGNASTGTETSTNSIFHWPREINALSVLTHEPLLPSGSDVWITQPAPLPVSMTPSSPSSPPPLLSAVDDFSMPTGILRIVDWMKLSPARVACWHSHVSAIRVFIDKDDTQPEDVAVFLEDDIDMEKDIADRLSGIWKVLPAGWDIVLLGHCWSDETFYSPLSTPNTNFATHLHPSYSPKCTHAYALSVPGARRLLQHLRHPPFAYSRAIDHAFSWLIESGRLRAYSVVPSIVVQRKDTPSDILPGLGSERKEWLVNGVLGS